jgi:hypothetical protein
VLVGAGGLPLLRGGKRGDLEDFPILEEQCDA